MHIFQRRQRVYAGFTRKVEKDCSFFQLEEHDNGDSAKLLISVNAKPIISLFKLQFSSVTMLKLLTLTCPISRIHVSTTPFCNHLRHGTESDSPLLRFLGSLKNPCTSRGTYFYRRFFCSDSTDGSDPALESGSEAKRVESEGEDAESKSSSAIVPTVFRPEDCLTVSEDWSSS